MSDEEYSDSEFSYPEEEETAEKHASRCGLNVDEAERPESRK